MDGVLSVINLVLVELMFFSAFWFLIGAIDDLLVDIFWIARKIYRKIRYYTSAPPIAVGGLPAPQREGMLAVFIPAWQEASIIGQMLQNTAESWSRSPSQFRIYVGSYPNDKATYDAVATVAAKEERVRHVVAANDGPTSKADCLNQIWDALMRDEAQDGIKAKAVILHDAEDLIHPDELTVHDRLIEQNVAVQLPVLPLLVPGSSFVSGHYCDEFAESHGKEMVLREAIGASVPLAGVACAIDRNILQQISQENGGNPFDASSLTEDYELGFKLRNYGNTVFVRIRDEAGNLVASRGYFPKDISAAVTQKSRWMIGIALAGWDKLGWKGNLPHRWMLLRDRRAPLAALVLFSAYLSILLGGLALIFQIFGVNRPIDIPEWLMTILIINFGFLVWRLFMRAAFVWYQYGWRQGLLSIPRSLVANIIAIMAARRACMIYIRNIFGAPLGWDKTDHPNFPDAPNSSNRG